MLTVVDLSRSPRSSPLVSLALVSAAEQTLEAGKKVFVYLPRRGEYRCLICNDCSFLFRCPYCVVSIVVHRQPAAVLRCHTCHYSTALPVVCSQCQGSHLRGIGGGLQQIEQALALAFPRARVTRHDTDAASKSAHREAEIILSTQSSLLLSLVGLGLIVYASLEADLSFPSYAAEEDLIKSLSIARYTGLDMLIQTEIPGHPIVTHLQAGTLGALLLQSLPERKQFGYPPYQGLAEIEIAHKSKSRVEQLARKLASKATTLATSSPSSPSTTILYEPDTFRHYFQSWSQRITLRGPAVAPIIQALQPEIVLNREIALHWECLPRS